MKPVSKNTLKRFFAVTFSAVLCLSLAVPALAKESDDQKIGAIALNIVSNYETGDSPSESDFSVTTTTPNMFVDSYELDYSSATKNDGENWSKYDSPVLTIYLGANSGYYFDKGSSKGNFSFTGTTCTYLSSKIDSDKYEVELKVQLTSISGKIGNVSNVHWQSNAVGAWTKGYKNTKYTVELYRDGSHVTTQTTTHTYYDFRDYMHKAGTYTFEVEGASKDYSADNIASPENYISDVVANQFANETADNSSSSSSSSSSGPGAGPGSTSTGNSVLGPTSGPGSTSTTGWQKNSDGTWYYLQNGSKVTGWQFINTKWYLFNAAGTMLTGFQNVDNKTYYLCADGDMKTGWQNINNAWYNFDGSGAMRFGWFLDGGRWYYLGTDGKMMTGWYTSMDGKKYYLNPNAGGPQGSMVTGVANINGQVYNFDASGALMQ